MSLEDGALDLEDLARRYDAQVLREHLLEQEEARSAHPMMMVEATRAQGPQEAQPLPVVHDLRPRCFRRLRWLLLANFLCFWSAAAHCGYSYHARVVEMGLKAAPPLEVSLLTVFVLGTQATVELAVCACLTRPARAMEARSTGFRSWDGAAWLTGMGARASVLLDVQCLPLMRRGSSLLFLLSFATFAFAIGIFVFVVQLRLLAGLFLSRDQFSYDKPDLFLKGRDASGWLEGQPLAALPPGGREDEEQHAELRGDRVVPVNTVKAANLAHFCDLAMLHGVIARLYIPMSCQETQEFVKSVTSFSRCFCEDVVQCSVKFFFLMDCEINSLVLVSLLVSASQAIASCLYASTASIDLSDARSDDEFHLHE